MMGKTHLAVGIAASFAVCGPKNWEECFAALIGGAVGSLICDVECNPRSGAKLFSPARLFALALTALLMTADIVMKAGLWQSIVTRDRALLMIGGLCLLCTCLVGSFYQHRTFTHSLLFVGLVTFGFFGICPALTLPVGVGALSHLAFDSLNWKDVPWLYPVKKGFCLHLCRASRVLDNTVLWIFTAADLLLVGRYLYGVLKG